MLRINDTRKEITEEKFIEEMKRFPNNVGYIINQYAFPEWLMEKYSEKLDWEAISKYQIFSENFAHKFSYRLNLFEATSKNNDFDFVTTRWSDNFLRKFYKYLNWFYLWGNRSEEFLREFIPLATPLGGVSWGKILRGNNNLREAFLGEFIKVLDVNALCKYQKLSEEFLEKYAVYLPWAIISRYQDHLSEKFIENHSDNMDWHCVALYQKNISEYFLLKHKDKFHFEDIPLNHKLSEDFIWENKHLLNIEFVLEYQIMSKHLCTKLVEWCRDEEKKQDLVPKYLFRRPTLTRDSKIFDIDYPGIYDWHYGYQNYIINTFESIWDKGDSVSWNEFLTKAPHDLIKYIVRRVNDIDNYEAEKGCIKNEK